MQLWSYYKVWVVAAFLGHCDWFEAEGVVLHANLYDRAVHALLQVAASEGELAGLPGSELQGLSELSNGLLPLLVSSANQVVDMNSKNSMNVSSWRLLVVCGGLVLSI